MTIDVSVERVIPAPPEQVAAYAMNWRHDAEWTPHPQQRLARIRVRGGGGGFYRMAAPLLARPLVDAHGGSVRGEPLVAAVTPPGSHFATELARLKARVGR
jgi:hypothetical protein